MKMIKLSCYKDSSQYAFGLDVNVESIQSFSEAYNGSFLTLTDGQNLRVKESPKQIKVLIQAQGAKHEPQRIAELEQRNQELAATVERLRDAYHQLIGNADTIVDYFGNVLIAECDYNDLCKVVEATPKQNLAEHDAEVVVRAIEWAEQNAKRSSDAESGGTKQ